MASQLLSRFQPRLCFFSSRFTCPVCLLGLPATFCAHCRRGGGRAAAQVGGAWACGNLSFPMGPAIRGDPNTCSGA